jgi:DNA-binding NtrC family response regulator
MSSANILVVDDDVEICRILDRILSYDKYEVRTGHSVADALGALKRNFFDVYLLDYNLPDGTGLDVAARIRSKGSEAPIILLSGYDPSAVALRAENLRLFATIAKPFSRTTISNTVKKAIESLRSALA